MRQSRQLRAFYFVFFLSSSGILAFRNVYFRDIGLSGTEMGLVGSVLLIVGLLVQPVWGLFGDRWGAQKRLVLVSLAASGLLALVYPFGADFEVVHFVALTALFAAFWAPIRPLSNSLVLSSGHGYGEVRAYGSVAFGVGTLGYGLLLARLPPVVLFYVYAVGVAAALVLVRSISMDDDAAPPDGLGLRALALVRNPPFAGLLASAFCLGVALTASNSFFVLYVHAIGGGNAITGAAFALKTVAEAITFLALVRVTTAHRVLFVGGALAHAIVFAAYVVVATPLAVLVAQLLLGIGYASVMVAAVNLADELAPRAMRATAQTALIAIGFGVGGAVGELLSGRLLEVLGVRYLFGVYAVAAVVASAVCLVAVAPDRSPGTAG